MHNKFYACLVSPANLLALSPKCYENGENIMGKYGQSLSNVRLVHNEDCCISGVDGSKR